MLGTGALDDGNGWGGPVLATDVRRDNNGNVNVHGEKICGGGGSGSGGGGGNNGNDNEDEGGGDNNNDSSDDDNNGGGDSNDDSSDSDDNSGSGGNNGGGCDTATAAGIDTDNNQLKQAMDNGRERPRGRPWFPCSFSSQIDNHTTGRGR